MSLRRYRKEVFKELSKKMVKSDLWCILRIDYEGTHVHTEDPEHFFLILAQLFIEKPEYKEMLDELIESTKEETS